MRKGSTSRPLYVPQVGQRRCGRFGCPHVLQTLTFAAVIACVARRLSRRDLEVFRLGTAMTGGQYSHATQEVRLPVRSENGQAYARTRTRGLGGGPRLQGSGGLARAGRPGG